MTVRPSLRAGTVLCLTWCRVLVTLGHRGENSVGLATKQQKINNKICSISLCVKQ